MKLPPLWMIVVSQALVWCVAGAFAHGWKILLYPLSWLAVGGAFYLHSMKYPIKMASSSSLSSGPFANSMKSADEQPEKVRS